METVYFFNTLSRKKEVFKPIKDGEAGIYACGPTVYGDAHIGNFRTYIFEDVLRRSLESFGYSVKHVMNVTDVGHLESDADEGDDKMEIAARRTKKSPQQIARHYENVFFEDAKALNILRPTVVCRATDHIPEMIEFISDLVTKKSAYVVDGNVYFDTSSFPSYSDFAKLDHAQMTEHARVEKDERKRNPHDFLLWLSQSKFPNQIMKWDSPWGVGFPGWHIECSAMAGKHLGPQIDIHCGGIDHISVHHTNEIAQSEARYGNRYVNYWLHSDFLVLDKGKMSKSKGETLTVRKLAEAGYDPLHYRYLCLGAHYRSQLRFSYEAMDGARNGLETLKNKVNEWKNEPQKSLSEADRRITDDYRSDFSKALADDLNTPVGLAVLWSCLRDNRISNQAKLAFFEKTNAFLGLVDDKQERLSLSLEQQDLVKQREQARTQKDWGRADEIRKLLLEQGIIVKDTKTGGTECSRKPAGAIKPDALKL